MTYQELMMQIVLLKDKLEKNHKYFEAWSKPVPMIGYEPVMQSYEELMDQWLVVKQSMEVFIKENS